MDRERLLIVGASGFLGSNFAIGARRQYSVVAHSSRSKVRAVGMQTAVSDLTEAGSARRLIQETKPDLVINCSALADPDLCETYPDRAERLNTEVPEELARQCSEIGADLIHISTDAVFGVGDGPFNTEDTPRPVNIYGATKLEGEHRVRDALPTALIVRTNIVGWSPTGQRSLLEYFHSRLMQGQAAPGFVDASFRPVSANQLWPLLMKLRSDRVDGIWHATGSIYLSKFQFGRSIAEIFGLDPSLVLPSSIHSSTLSATRPLALDVVPSSRSNGLSYDVLGIESGLLDLRVLMESGYRAELESFVG